ncbi:hypothetical protein C8P68_101516 [Mucilaginibacter yixingensis]|uniref:Nucleotide-diphospho-sugar transferase n=1 Tax=Mucilaginibacter yixingensis TaxID=1295612 RepID=A0A2T5JFS7_9SPHI|nr:nucleotide-diphospho-sugar transferase [Mucilaginibacter yixingensis]PTR01282.1 hypothetical protein C8P68_101516 [Mucilaginibacter yixingensis]
MLQTPVLFIIFNRPKQTSVTFNAIRAQKPKQLFVAADGPRADHQDDEAQIAACKAIIKAVDWDCEIKTHYRDKNLGCGAGPADAITWFFSHVEEGIILEDDCVANPSFFDFCTVLLQRYRDTEQVMMICGTSYQPAPLDTTSYYFSKYPHVWGWASWRRAWSRYNFVLDYENESAITEIIARTFINKRERIKWIYNMNLIKTGLDAWDYQWMYWIWKNNGLCITPWRNMISNIGFGVHATHTFDAASKQAEMLQYELTGIVHPAIVKQHQQADAYERFHILIDPLPVIYRRKFQSVINRIKNVFS